MILHFEVTVHGETTEFDLLVDEHGIRDPWDAPLQARLKIDNLPWRVAPEHAGDIARMSVEVVE